MLTCSLLSLCQACKKDGEPAAPSPTAGAILADPWFENVARAAGLDVVHLSAHDQRFLFPGSESAGVCLIDYDNDGWLDIYFVQGGALGAEEPNQLGNVMYHNNTDGTFSDVTAEVGVGDTGYGMGCTCGDYDADGDIDLYVTNLEANVLYRNSGDGTFANVTTSAGGGDPHWSASAVFTDYDGDGWLDLFVVNYVNWRIEQEVDCSSRSGQPDYCSPNSYRSPARDSLYRNLGDGTFSDVTVASGVSKSFGNGLGAISGDFNGDGRMDLYAANDQMPNQLWINQGDGTFEDQALISGSAVNHAGVAEAGMGIVAVDIGNDGDLDLFLTHLHEETNTLYENRSGFFTDVTAQAGLGAPSLPFTGFGVGFADFDHDGYRDVYIANGRVNRRGKEHSVTDPYAEPNLLFKGLDDSHFKEFSPRGGTANELIDTSRAAAFGDLDNDGDIDIVVANKDQRMYLLKNIVGDSGNWLMLRVLNRKGVDAVGAILTVDSGGRQQWRYANPCYSYCAGNDPRVHVGLGTSTTVDSVVVRWPDGSNETFGPFQANKLRTIQQGSGK